MLKSVAIENYRSCVRTSIELHPNLSVLIGPNGSGKTNILQAIMFLTKMAHEERFRTPHSDAFAVSSRIKARFSLRRTEVQLDARFVASTDESNVDAMLGSRQKWKFTTANGNQTSFEAPLALGTYLHGGITPEVYLRHFSRNAFRYMTGSKEVPGWALRSMAQISEYCKGIRYYGASQFTNPGNCPASFHIEQEGKHRRLARFRGHTKILYGMYSAKKNDPTRFEQFLDIVGPRGLRLIDDLKFREVPTSSVDYLVRVGGRVEARKRNKLLVIPQFKVGKQRLSPNQLSEGTFKTLALLFHVITDDGTVLLIEEPEVCVHHGLLSSILELIKSSSHQKQMILSTHSDFVLDHVEPENVYRVSFDKTRGTIVRHIPSAMTTKEYSALREYLHTEGNLGEYWREGGLGDRP